MRTHRPGLKTTCFTDDNRPIRRTRYVYPSRMVPSWEGDPVIEIWHVGLLASAVIAVSFGAVGVKLGLDITRTGQWLGNPLAVATVFLYVSCASSHGIRTIQLLENLLGVVSTPALAAGLEYGYLHMVGLDAVTAFAGVWYWTLRNRYPSLVRGTAIFEDLRSRQRQALAVHDGVVQGLSEAKLALEAGETDAGQEALDDTLDEAKGLITDLMEGEETPEGELRREER